MKFLITDLDFTLIVPTQANTARPYKDNWKINISEKYLKSFDKIFIVTNQADSRINLSYITEVKKYLIKLLKKDNIMCIINKKRDIYRKPHVMSFLKYIKPHIKRDTNITWLGDQEDDYKYFCNCILHLSNNKLYNGKYLYYNISNLNSAINPIFIKDNFVNDSLIQFKNNQTILIHMFILDMISTFLSIYKSFQIIKDFKEHYLLYNEKLNIKIYIGRFNHEIKNVDTQYILNSCVDTERIARYFQYTIYKNYFKNNILNYYKKHENIKVIKMYPRISIKENKLFFLEMF